MLALVLTAPFLLAETIEDTYGVEIFVSGTGLKCSNDRTNWLDLASPPPYNPISSLNDCYRDPGVVVPGTDNVCCPSGSICDLENPISGPLGDIYLCAGTSITRCRYYTSENACEDDAANVAEQSVDESSGGDAVCGPSDDTYMKGSEECWENTVCGCVWNETLTTCEPNYRVDEVCDGISGTTEAEYGICTFRTISETDECDESNKMYATIAGIWTPLSIPRRDDCPVTQNIEIDCESLVKLGFFGLFNFLVAVGILISIYCFKIKFSKKE